MNDRPSSLVTLAYLLTDSDTEQSLLGMGLALMMLLCKHKLQWRRSNVDRTFVRFKGYGANNPL